MSSAAPSLSVIEPSLARPVSVAVVGVGEADLRLVLQALPDGASAMPVPVVSGEAEESLRQRRPDLVVIGLDSDRSGALWLAERLRASTPELALLALATTPEPGAIREAMRGGFRDYLVLPDDTSALRRAVVEVASRVSPLTGGGAERGQVTVVMGAKGGSGTTLLAVNLGAELAQRQDTLLVDLDFGMGDAAVFLDLTVERSINDVLRNVSRLDRKLLESTVSKRSERLSLLPQPAMPLEDVEVQTEAIMRSLEVGAELAEHVIVDCGARVDEASMAAASMADRILLVCTPDVPSVRAAWIRLQLLERLDVPDQRVALVVNRWGRPGALSRSDIEENLARPVYATVADDTRTVMAAVNDGQLLQAGAGRARITKDLAGLAKDLGGDDGQTGGGGKARWFHWGR